MHLSGVPWEKQHLRHEVKESVNLESIGQGMAAIRIDDVRGHNIHTLDMHLVNGDDDDNGEIRKYAFLVGEIHMQLVNVTLCWLFSHHVISSLPSL